jgi:uncharacterized protein with ParB-like and HNH nuclease domain
MIQSAEIYQISNIFDIDTKVKYEVPKYQREYIWGKEQWENLFNDLSDSDGGHFLGSIICINNGVDALGMTPLEVIDGQQRLTTISLLFASIYNKLRNDERNDDDFITERSNLKHRLTQKRCENTPKLELCYQNNNFEDYNAILAEIGLYDRSNKPSRLGNKRIYKAYQYFNENLRDLDYHQVMEILYKINSALLVKIEVNSHSDAFVLFETLNNRGMPLSAMDIIKNKILSELENKKVRSVDEAYDEWLKLVGNLPDPPIQERFLRQYYNAFKYKERIKVEKFHRATKHNLIKIYENLINRDSGFIFDELIEKSRAYNLFVEPDDNGSDSEYHNGLTDLLHIGAAPSYTFLLYLFAEHENNHGLIEGSIKFLMKYFVRRNLTDFPGTRDLDTIFIGLIDECERNRDDLTPSTISNYLTQSTRFSDINTFKKKLEGDIYDDNVAVTRFILCKIEENHQTKEIHTDLWAQGKNKKSVWTIEHIFPEGVNIPGEWVDMVANGDENKANELHVAWVHKLGNLTMTGYNSNLSNFPFEEKRDRKNNKGDYIGYKNGLYLNKELADKGSWTAEEIESRTGKIVIEALELFKFDNERID